MCVGSIGLGRAMSVLSRVRGTLAVALVMVPSMGMAQAPAAPPASQPAEQAAPPCARWIIDRHIEAVGGRKVIMGHSSTRSIGTVTVSGSGLSGSFEILAAKPDRSLLRITLNGIGEVTEGFDGKVAWNKSPM